MIKKIASILTSVGALGVLLSGCSAAVEGEPSDFLGEESVGEVHQAVLSNCTSGQLGSSFMTHTCNHATLGPWFGTRAASNTTPPWFGRTAGDTTTGDPLPALGDSGYPHIYYTVTLPNVSPGVYSGKMKFKTGSVYGAGDYAILWNNLTSILVEQGGSTINRDSAITANPGVMSCSGFTGYNVYPLTASTSTQYDITLTANTSTVQVSFERIGDHVKRAYQDLDSDTWGNTGVSVLTACVPPAGYSAARGSDCNESNASIYPFAPETCGDGIDSNCNGNDCT
jgi:hypothetical protein